MSYIHIYHIFVCLYIYTFISVCIYTNKNLHQKYTKRVKELEIYYPKVNAAACNQIWPHPIYLESIGVITCSLLLSPLLSKYYYILCMLISDKPRNNSLPSLSNAKFITEIKIYFLTKLLRIHKYCGKT